MAQSKAVAAMRMRLIRKGYADVKVTMRSCGDYLVQGREPLAGFGVQLMVSPDEVNFIGRW